MPCGLLGVVMSGLGPPSLSLLVVAPLLLPPLLPAPLSKSVWTLRIVTALTFTLEDFAGKARAPHRSHGPPVAPTESVARRQEQCPANHA